MIEQVRGLKPFAQTVAEQVEKHVPTAVNQVQSSADQALRTVAVSDAFSSFTPFRFGERRVTRFIDLHPAITKIYFLCHIFSIVSIVTTIPKLYKHGRRLIVKTGMERFDAAMKIFAKLGEVTISLATVAVGLEAFKFGEKLGRWGLGFAQTAYKTMSAWLDTIVIVGAVFSAAQTVIDLRKWWRTRSYQNEMMAQTYYRANGAYTAKEYVQFREHLIGMAVDNEKRMGKALGVDGASFRKAALAQLSHKDPTGADMARFKQIVEKMTGKLQVGKTLHMITAVTDLATLAASGLLLVPHLHPLAAVLIVASAVSTLATTLFGNINQYQFEDSMGMIDRPAPNRLDWKDRVVDFTKWQLGWYEERSLIKRLTTVGSNLWENGLVVGEVFSAMLGAVRTFMNFFK